MNHLLTSDHQELDELLGQLFSAIDTGVTEEVFEKLDMFWARLAMHIRAEHLHLLPTILDAVKSQQQTDKTPSLESVQNEIERLHNDHDFFMRELATAVKLMREINKSDSQDFSKEISIVHEKVSAVSQKLKEHNELEESEVYGWADTLLDPSEHTILNEKMQKELDNLPPRFS
jgi:hemerythrin-like domain-containing protein